jgi:hypothetical protein
VERLGVKYFEPWQDSEPPDDEDEDIRPIAKKTLGQSPKSQRKLKRKKKKNPALLLQSLALLSQSLMHLQQLNVPARRTRSPLPLRTRTR